MSEPLPDGQRRASHEDREQVAERLRDAAGDGRISMDELEQRLETTFAARTYAELEPLTRDLPEPGTGRTAARRATTPARVTHRQGSKWSIAFLSGSEKRGHWRIGRDHTAAAVLGGVDLDLREAELEAHEITIRVFALMGGIDIVVPEDCETDVNGTGLMGGFDQHDKAAVPPPGAPVVRVRGFAVMGGVDVVRRAGGPPGTRPSADQGDPGT